MQLGLCRIELFSFCSEVLEGNQLACARVYEVCGTTSLPAIHLWKATSNHMASSSAASSMDDRPVRMRGFKVVLGHDDGRSKFSGQTEKHWSAIYVQLACEHALRYLPTKYEATRECMLAEFWFDPGVRFIHIEDGRIPDPSLSSDAKAAIVRDELRDKHGLVVAADRPLLLQLGEHRVCLVLKDDESGTEIAVPHALLEADGHAEVKGRVRFTRSEHSIMRTLQCSVDGVVVALTREEKEDPSVLVRRLLAGELKDWR